MPVISGVSVRRMDESRKQRAPGAGDQRSRGMPGTPWGSVDGAGEATYLGSIATAAVMFQRRRGSI
jgi:hypothetical protein